MEAKSLWRLDSRNLLGELIEYRETLRKGSKQTTIRKTSEGGIVFTRTVDSQETDRADLTDEWNQTQALLGGGKIQCFADPLSLWALLKLNSKYLEPGRWTLRLLLHKKFRDLDITVSQESPPANGILGTHSDRALRKVIVDPEDNDLQMWFDSEKRILLWASAHAAGKLGRITLELESAV